MLAGSAPDDVRQHAVVSAAGVGGSVCCGSADSLCCMRSNTSESLTHCLFRRCKTSSRFFYFTRKNILFDCLSADLQREGGKKKQTPTLSPIRRPDDDKVPHFPVTNHLPRSELSLFHFCDAVNGREDEEIAHLSHSICGGGGGGGVDTTTCPKALRG